MAKIESTNTTGNVREDGRVEVILTLEQEPSTELVDRLRAKLGDLIGEQRKDRPELQAFLEPDSVREELTTIIDGITAAAAEVDGALRAQTEAVEKVNRELELFWWHSKP